MSYPSIHENGSDPKDRVLSEVKEDFVISWHGVIIDCEQPRTLAKFYEDLLGYVRVNDEEDWVVIGKSADHAGIAFQQISNYKAPVWPSGDVPTQMHLDFKVENLEESATIAIRLGAKAASTQNEGFTVMLDPEGHPFCFVL